MPQSVSDLLLQNGIKSDSLSHYGVPGMRWGKRRGSKGSSSTSGEPKKTIKDLSDEELRSKINRIKLEQEYTRLTTPQKSAGRKAIGSLLQDVGKAQAKSFLNKGVPLLVDAMLDNGNNPKHRAK